MSAHKETPPRDLLTPLERRQRVIGMLQRQNRSIAQFARDYERSYPQVHYLLMQADGWQFPDTYVRVARVLGVDWKWLLLRRVDERGEPLAYRQKAIAAKGKF